ncbi:MAG TPA: YidC/Oxa1 family membrane protein insertase [Candidatus Polarisedimenticolaceae bacterium]|nr:YidC/Oxa1 family membrane protein insertase [Candidatus Polarisedimenticolaceae bacterium]
MFTTIFVQPLFNVLFVLYALVPGHDFGVAVILLTILVRLALWPLVTRQLHSQRVLQKLQPEVAKVRKAAGGDRQKESKMLMELYKEKGTNPFASILPLLVQLPIFFALYIVLRDAVRPDEIAKLAYDFVLHLGPVADIVQKHTTFEPTLFGLIDLTKPYLPLGILAGLAQFYQARQLMPQTMAAGGDQAKLMKNMTYVFPVLTAGISLTLPSALALYWMVTSLVAAFQQYWVLLRDAEELEAVEDKLHPAPGGSSKAISDGKPTLTKAQRKAAARKANAKTNDKGADANGGKAE